MHLSKPLHRLVIIAASAASLIASQDIAAMHPQQSGVVALGSAKITEGYLSWSNTNFPPTDVLRGLVGTPSADPDSDGLPNLLEYALGSDPNHSRVEESIYLTREDDIWTFSFSTPISRPDVTYVFESSCDLVTWRPVIATQAIITGDTSTQFWIARIVAHGSEPIFIRVRVTLRPS